MTPPVQAAQPSANEPISPPQAPEANIKPNQNQPPALTSTEPKTPPPVDTTQKWRFTLRGFGSGARLGGPAGGIFGHDFSNANQYWDHTRWGLDAGFSYNLFERSKYFQLWVGAQLGYLNLSGNDHSPGQLNGLEFGGHIAAASRGLYQSKTFLGPELGLYLSGLYAKGRSTA